MFSSSREKKNKLLWLWGFSAYTKRNREKKKFRNDLANVRFMVITLTKIYFTKKALLYVRTPHTFAIFYKRKQLSFISNRYYTHIQYWHHSGFPVESPPTPPSSKSKENLNICVLNCIHTSSSSQQRGYHLKYNIVPTHPYAAGGKYHQQGYDKIGKHLNELGWCYIFQHS